MSPARWIALPLVLSLALIITGCACHRGCGSGCHGHARAMDCGKCDNKGTCCGECGGDDKGTCCDGSTTQGSQQQSSNAVSSGFEAIKQLEGTWRATTADGSVTGEIVYEVTSAGSAVRETMFPGHEHEMTNMYHLDGSSIVVTHYCAAGNQPRMRCTNPTSDTDIAFSLDSVSNLASPEAHYMGGLRLVRVNDSTVEQHWTSYDKGAPQPQQMVITLTRPQ